MTMVTKTSRNITQVTPADWLAGPPQGQWTYHDYAALPDDGNRYEIIDGVIYMSPAPNRWHQRANSLFVTYLNMYVSFKGLGEVYGPPFDVLMPGVRTVQPDVVVVLNDNLDIVTAANIQGAPDLVVEISSPSTATYDRTTKLNAYAASGVKEYWIADPITHTVEILTLEQGIYRPVGVFHGQDILPSVVIPELPIRVEQFFE